METFKVRKFLIILLLPVVALGVSFKDVPVNHWAYDAVNAVSELGIISGYPDGTFRGVDFVNRYQLAVALYRLIEYVKTLKPKTEGKTEGIPPEELSKLKMMLEDLKEKYGMVSGYVDEKFAQAMEKISSLEKSLSKYSLKCSQIEKKFGSRLDRLESSLGYLDGRISLVATSVQGMSEKIEALDEDIGKLKDGMTKLEKVYSVLMDYVDGVKNDFAMLKVEVEASVSKLEDEVKSKSVDFDLRIRALDLNMKKISEVLESSLTNVSSEILLIREAFSAKLSSLDRRQNRLEGEINTLKSDLETVQSSLTTELEKLEEDTEKLKSDLSDLERGVSKNIEKLREDLRSGIFTLSSKVSNLEERIGALEDLSKDLAVKSEVEEKVGNVSERLKRVEKNVDDLRGTVLFQWIVILLLAVGLGASIYTILGGES